MNPYEPKFTIEKRDHDNTYALNVTMPDGDKYNIWEFEKVPNIEIQKAIMSAFERGWSAHKQVIEQGAILRFNAGFEEIKT
jgi:hypothetical protein